MNIYKNNEIASKLISTTTTQTLFLQQNGRIKVVLGTLLKDSESKIKYDKGQTLISEYNNVVGIATTLKTSFALLSDGRVVYEGEKHPGYDNLSKLRNVKDIACEIDHFVALMQDGTVKAYGNNDYGQCNVSNWKNIKKIVCGASCTYGIKEDGTVVACGFNEHGECNVSEWKEIIDLTPGDNCAFGVTSSGQIVYCGDVPEFTKNHVDKWYNVVSISSDSTENNSLIALKNDGSVLCCNEYYDTKKVTAWKDMVEVVSNGCGLFIGITSTGKVVAEETSTFTVIDTTSGFKNIILFKNLDTYEEDRIKSTEVENRRIRISKILQKIKVPAIIILIAIVIGFGHHLFNDFLPKANYNNAVKLAQNGNSYEAYKTFQKLGDYEDSVKQTKKLQWKNCKKGDTVYFGKFEQDGNKDNGKEDLEWIVLSKKKGKVLVISKYIISSDNYKNFKRVDDGYGGYINIKSTTWKSSDVRKWLNNSFLKKSFTKKEKKKILTTTLSNSDNKEFNTDGGKKTKDKVFLLSLKEAKKYFEKDSDRKAKGTKVYKNEIEFSDRVNGNAYNWWLRTPGKNQQYAAVVEKSGELNSRGYPIMRTSAYDDGADGIRPAIWIKTK